MQKIYLFELKSLARYSIIRVIIEVQEYGIERSCLLTGKKKVVYEVVVEKPEQNSWKT
jgi:hypothetical protein